MIGFFWKRFSSETAPHSSTKSLAAFVGLGRTFVLECVARYQKDIMAYTMLSRAVRIVNNSRIYDAPRMLIL